MEKWIQKLSGAVIASVLALTLSARASADLQPDDADPDPVSDGLHPDHPR